MFYDPDQTAGTLPPVQNVPEGKQYLYDKTKNAVSGSVFSISFINNETGGKEYFNFALLPAIEPSGTRGQGGVPEVKPGIITMTSMKYKNFLIPGATPIIQSIGVQSTLHQFVGAFIGSETTTVSPTRASLNQVYRLDGLENPPWSEEQSAFQKAKTFDEKVVQGARPITMTLNSDITYKYEGVVTGFKFYTVRADRAYYTLDLLATVYPSTSRSTQFLSDGAQRGQSPATDIPQIQPPVIEDVKK